MALVRHRFKWMSRWMDRQTVSTSKQFFMPYTIYHIYLRSRHQKVGRTSGTIKFLLLTFGSFASAALPLLLFPLYLLPFLLPLLVPSFFAFFCKLSSTRDLKRHQNARRQQANFSLSQPSSLPSFPPLPHHSLASSTWSHRVDCSHGARVHAQRVREACRVVGQGQEVAGSEVTSASITSRE